MALKRIFVSVLYAFGYSGSDNFSSARHEICVSKGQTRPVIWRSTEEHSKIIFAVADTSISFYGEARNFLCFTALECPGPVIKRSSRVSLYIYPVLYSSEFSYFLFSTQLLGMIGSFSLQS